MAVHRVYTEDDHTTVYTILNSNGGNVRRTSIETGIPQRTIRNWKEAWEKDGFPEELLEQAAEVNNEFIDNMERVRHKALILMEQQLHEAKPNQLAVIFGILDDKIRLASGLATSRTETVNNQLPPPEKMKELFISMIQGAVEAQARREEDIIDAELVETAQVALPEGS